jgi:hypothetical protein
VGGSLSKGSFGWLFCLLESGVQKLEDRSQKSEDRSQKTEVRSQKTGVRRQESEDRSQKIEVCCLVCCMQMIERSYLLVTAIPDFKNHL